MTTREAESAWWEAANNTLIPMFDKTLMDLSPKSIGAITRGVIKSVGHATRRGPAPFSATSLSITAEKVQDWYPDADARVDIAARFG
jgi:hypothetical protein